MIKTIHLNLNNAYLIPVDKSYMLVDTGYPSDKKKFDLQLNRFGITKTDIAYLFITHCHDDHVGLVSDIIQANPSCKVIMHKKAAPKLLTGTNDMSRSQYINGRVASVIGVAKNFTPSGFPPYKARTCDILIEKDTSFKDLNINLKGKIITTSGHTDDSISVILDSGICFPGDAAAAMLGPLGTKHCIIIMENLQQYYASWQKILNHHAREIWPGHGKPFKANLLIRDMNKLNEQKMKAAR